MSWIEKLYKTYENNTDKIGSKNDSTPLLPIFHTTKKRAHIEIVLNENGDFKRASVIPEDYAKTILPATENSAGRTSGCAPHPLADQLQYIAAEYKQYGGYKKHYFESIEKKEKGYKDVLKEWAESEYANEKVKAVYRYISKGTLITDLVLKKIFYVDGSGKLLTSWKDKQKDKPKIFYALGPGQKQTDAFVRWSVEISDDPASELQYDKSVWNSWIDYYLSTRKKKTFCYVTGEMKYQPEQYPRMIRSDNDGAKIVSSNDKSGFTYLGRFTDGHQVCGVDVEITQKVHSALRWLIARQGKVFFVKKDPGLAIVAWATSGKQIPDPFADPFAGPLSILGEESLISDELDIGTTAQNIAIKFTKKMIGYKIELGDTSDIVVLGLDSATPGRLAIMFYRELNGSDFLTKIEKWHNTCAWIHDRFIEDKDNKKTKGKYLRFIGAPSPRDIAGAAYGSRVDDKLIKTTVERLLPCIIDGRQIPRDIVDSVVRRACNRVGMESWEWNKTLSIACALFRKFNEKEEYYMALDEKRKTRDYLYGRLLAAADCLEKFALFVSEKKRDTNAARMMQRFADRPCSTWKNIELSLIPYKARLGGRAKKYQDIIDEAMSLFEPAEDFTSDKPLSGEFLLGYHCQREELKPKKDEPDNIDDENLVEK